MASVPFCLTSVFFVELGLEAAAPRLTAPGASWTAACPWTWQLRTGHFDSGAVLEGVDENSVGVVMRSWFGAEGRLMSHNVLQPLPPALGPELAHTQGHLDHVTLKVTFSKITHGWLLLGLALASEVRLRRTGLWPTGEEQDSDYDKLLRELKQQRCAVKDSEDNGKWIERVALFTVSAQM